MGEANPAYHAQTTGPEILSDFAGRKLDYWVTGYGTGGTFQGAGKVIKQARPDVKIVLSDGQVAMDTAMKLAQQEGIFCGTSGGATVATALEVCAKAPEGSTVLAMIPDTAERYLSTPLFAAIDADMNEAELEISKTPPSAQLEG